LKIVPICLLGMLSAFAQLSPAQSGTPSVPEANPGRPTVSTPATLTPVGYLQFENGALFAEDSTEFSKRIGIGQVTKLSVLPRLELFLQSEPLAISQSKDLTAVHGSEGAIPFTLNTNACIACAVCSDAVAQRSARLMTTL
jgi:hypothetical protein